MELFQNRWYRTFAQIFFWSSLIAIMTLMFGRTPTPTSIIYRNFFHVFLIIGLIILNIIVFIPLFFSKKKYGKYFVAVVLSVMLATSIMAVADSFFFKPSFEKFKTEKPRNSPPKKKPPFGLFDPKLFIDFIFYSAVIMVGTVLESIQLHREQEKLTTLIQNEKLETEMKFLKSQINPHFLFNVLNNVYTLSLIKSEQTPEVVMKLSEMLRYMLYDSNQEKVCLEQEIMYIKNYVSLQQLKDKVPLEVHTTFKVHNTKSRIAPMILIPFVENAFKHSKIEDTTNGWITIILTSSENLILLQVDNSIVESNRTKDATGGIGLKNVKRRLELEYPNKHRLEIIQNEKSFSINLSINLK